MRARDRRDSCQGQIAGGEEGANAEGPTRGRDRPTARPEGAKMPPAGAMPKAPKIRLAYGSAPRSLHNLSNVARSCRRKLLPQAFVTSAAFSDLSRRKNARFTSAIWMIGHVSSILLAIGIPTVAMRAVIVSVTSAATMPATRVFVVLLARCNCRPCLSLCTAAYSPACRRRGRVIHTAEHLCGHAILPNCHFR